MKASALEASGSPYAALAMLDSVLAREPRYRLAWDTEVRVLAHRGAFQQAIVCCDSALTIDPTDQWAREMRTHLLGHLQSPTGPPAPADLLDSPGPDIQQ